MPGPLYVPVLPTRPHALAAYRALRPDVQAQVVPLWTLPPHPGMRPQPLAQALRKDAGRVAAAHRHGPAWLDAPFADEGEAAVLAGVLPPDWWAERRTPRPVTGPDRPTAQRSWALAAAQQQGCGLGIRVSVPGEWNDRTTTSARRLLERTDPTLPVHLLLDLGAVLPSRPDASKEALRALDALVPLASWRTVAVASGGFPEPPEDFREGTLYEAPRPDWETWHEIRHSGRSYLPLLRYGDYGILPAAYTARTPASGNGGPAWGVLRYTTPRSYLLAMALQRGTHRDAVNRAAARSLTGLPDFRGPSAGAGEGWLRDCAQGSVTTGNHSVWNRVGNMQHMTFVVSSLTARSDNEP
ncbi:beta family protein [Streptomyces sp. TRM S81-3]|uniref:Beta family protein n=1 Tax=Streptomyces griseicoloratus TaxID=2752516 RepID=A0A926L025_9ACTN|nr:beta family protein [Streptomyces griseicoloratus]MBD0417912.1 beta family protein [Streptomyces griseicoloratus]